MSVLGLPTEIAASASAPAGAWSDPAPAALEQAPAGLTGPDGVMLPEAGAAFTPWTGRAIHVLAGALAPQVVLRDGAADTVLPALWLRARSADPTQRDTVTGQRLMNPHLLPDDLTLTEARLEGTGLHLAFSDGFAGSFDPAGTAGRFGARRSLPGAAAVAGRPGAAAGLPWDALQDDAVLVRALKDYVERGFLLIHGTPTQPDSILSIARRFGFVRETNFGSFFEVYSRPDSTDLAYRPVALGPHTDNPYRNPVPGIQLLHCLQNETSGGLSTLVDSLAVAQQLQQEDPQGFALLASVPVRFEYRDADTWLVSVQPMIELDRHGRDDRRVLQPAAGRHPADVRGRHPRLPPRAQALRHPAGGSAVRTALPARAGPADDVRQQPGAARPHLVRSVRRPSPAAGLLH